MKRFLALLLSGSALFLYGKSTGFDRGGVSIDFSKISQERFAGEKKGSADLLTPNWRPGTVFVHSSDPRAQKVRSKALPLIKFQKTANVLKTVKPGAIADDAVAGKYARSISASWTQKITLPDRKGGEYRLRFRSKVHSAGTTGGCMPLVVVTVKKADGKSTTLVKVFKGGSKEFQENEIQFHFPENSVSAFFYLRLDGCGTMEITPPQLEKVKHAYPVEIDLHPNGKMDNIFAISRNDPAIIALVLKRNVPAKELKMKELRFEVTLPEGVEFVDTAQPLKLISRNGQKLIFDASFWEKRLLMFNGYETHMKLAFLVTTKAPVGSLPQPVRCRLTDGGKALTDVNTFRIKVIPQIKSAALSSSFLIGYQPMGLYINFDTLRGREMFARFSGRTGFGWVGHKFNVETAKLYRKYGTKIITPELYWLANGYRVGAKKPEYARFKPLSKTASFDVNNATCPAAVYNKTPFYTEIFEPYLKENLKELDGVIANWEPFMFHGQGCFCDRCCDEFADFVKIPRKEMKKMWPKELTITGKLHKQGVRFRSLQHAKLVKTIHQSVNKYTSGKAGFIPEVVWITCADTLARGGANAEHDPLDYAGSLTCFDPWGPYTGWPSLEPYNYTKALNLDTYIAAKRVRRFMKERLGDKCPKLVALPHGLQGKFWVTTPEAMAMEVTGFFVQGYHSALLYLFPQGYDNRYWSVMARCNDQIARNEEFVFKGKRVTETVSVAPVTPFPRPKKRIAPRYLKDPPPESLLQVEAFRKGETLLAAVGNYWEKGDVFFKLKVKGLKKQTLYAVSEAAFNRSFVNNKGTFFTGAELEKGVTLHAGALRWAFFRVEPAALAPAMSKKVTPRQLEDASKAHLSAIQKAVKEENALDDAIEAEFRKSELRVLSKGALKCLPVTEADGSQKLLFTSGKNSLTFELNHCAVKNWKIDGSLWIDTMGKPMFWQPSNNAPALYKVTKQELVKEGIQVTVEKLFTRRDAAALEHLTVRSTLLVSPDLRSLKITTTLIDSHNAETGGGGFTLGFRYHLFPGNMDGKTGDILLKAKGKDLLLPRTFERHVFAKNMSSSAQQVNKLFECTRPPVLIDNSTVFLRRGKSPDRIRLQAYPEKLFAGYAVWDTPQLPFPTFEPFFHAVSIERGKNAVFTIELKAEKRLDRK